MNRVVARLPETVTELCLVRFGIQVRRSSAWLFARRLLSQITGEARRATADGAGLLGSESFSISIMHFGVLQYWRSFDDLEAWSHRPPHAEWWRRAVQRMRLKQDLGVYHEAFLVRAQDIESIYMDCRPTGLATFGLLGEPVGEMTTSRGRLRRSKS
jgi:hypothetical protein